LAAHTYCPNLKIITFTTNGLIPEKALEYALFTHRLGFDVFITVSLDGNKEVHDRLRGVKGNYESAQKTYNLLKKNQIPCYFGLNVSDQNSTFIHRHYNAYNREIKAITFVHSKGIYNKNNKPDYNVIFKALVHIFKNFNSNHVAEIIEKIHIKVALHFIKQKLRKNILPCEVINTSLHMMADGTIKPCMYLPSLGNIKNNTIIDILKSSRTKELKYIIKQGQCSHCWINCYSPHTIMQHPLKSLYYLFKRVS
ncbi:MAG: SPASM domain-containing protein, partial [Spirochaetales bacterium]|nr:SPASM domain-containing protein [Spirochaetales bacterium]